MAQRTKRLRYLDIMLYSMTRGRVPKGSASDPVGLLDLTTTGRKTGQPRTVSLGYVRSDGAYVVMASNSGQERHPAWYHNLRANPRVMVRAHGREFSAMAEVAGPAERGQLWERFIELAPMYRGYQTKTQREIPLVVLRPTPAS